MTSKPRAQAHPGANAPAANQNPPPTGQPAALVPAPLPAGAGALAAVLPADVLARLAAHAKDAAAKERPSLSKISLQSGQIAYQGTPVPRNELPCIIVGMAYSNAYYPNRFNKDKPENPACFALSETGENMVPHENSAKQQHQTCRGCPMAEWGSDPNGGRGKACKQQRRLVLAPGSAAASAADMAKAELALLTLPVMSVRNYSAYVNELAATGLTDWAVQTVISTVPDAKSQFRVTLRPVSVLAPDVIEAVELKREEAARAALTPYDPPSDEDADDVEDGPAQKKTKF